MEQRMKNSSYGIVSLSAESEAADRYDNHPIAHVNDHVIRISIMTQAYHWHCHPDSDETFLALEGGLFIDFEDQTLQLLPGQMLTVNKGVFHRTRPMGERSVNLTFERSNALCERLRSSPQSSTL
jgi:mannose-6-phosphate isomerase-like protein (cupin superfamily)